MHRFHVMGIWGLGLALNVSAQIHAIEPDQAGPDFPLQGEYQGEVAITGGRQILAAQVTALGDGGLRAVFFPRGFPGAGWTGSDRAEATGLRSGDKAAIAGQGYQVSVSAASLIGTGPGGVTVQLNRITRSSPTLGMAAPATAKVLFDGVHTDAWASPKVDSRGLLGVPATTNAQYGNFSVHLEFRVPFEPSARGQERGNSGFCMPTSSWSELQVLDSFGDAPLIDGCGAIYNTAPPRLTANLPPLSWQTYDIQFTAPVFKNGARVSEAKLTAWLDGVLVQDHTTLLQRPATSVLLLQDHGHQVFYRNIWIVDGRDDFNFSAASGNALRAPRGREAAPDRNGSAAGMTFQRNRPAFILWDALFGADGRMIRP